MESPGGELHLGRWGWMAGILDGEGSVSYTPTHRGVPCFRFMVYTTSPEMAAEIQRMASSIGLKWTEWVDHRDRESALGHRPCTCLSMQGQAAVRLYEAVAPFLIRHADAAAEAVAFLKVRYDRPVTRGGVEGKRRRVHWTKSDCDEWEALRVRWNPKNRGPFEGTRWMDRG